MHGVILYGLKQFVLDTYDEDAWGAIVEGADIDRQLFVPVTDYPDEYVVAIVEAAADLTGNSPATLQREFGRYVVPQLVETYGVHVDAEWTGLELVENVEAYIHEALRAKNLSEFAPPAIGAGRVGDGRVLVTYGSDREMCDVAKGILEGIADYYEESWTVTERTCMHDGDARCEILVEQAPTLADEAAAANRRSDGVGSS